MGLNGVQEVAGSNPVAPTITLILMTITHSWRGSDCEVKFHIYSIPHHFFLVDNSPSLPHEASPHTTTIPAFNKIIVTTNSKDY